MSSTGSITFTPDRQFVRTPDPVTVKRVDKGEKQSPRLTRQL